jgi:phosphoribosylformylglycinamidine synthase
MAAILILHASGANRDSEARRAIELAGGCGEIVHINQLRGGSVRLADYGGIVLPGGFSYGDALGAGVRLALDLQVFLQDELQAFVAAGRPILGICNGFQTLVKAGILGLEEQATAKGLESMARRRVTLTANAGGHFECRWVHLAVEGAGRTSWLNELPQRIYCPVAHGEGNFQVDSLAALDALEAQGLVVMRYVAADGEAARGRYPLNPNGSAGDIAGICNASGTVLGLMPHPEDHITAVQSPQRAAGNDGLGLPLFKAFVAAC